MKIRRCLMCFRGERDEHRAPCTSESAPNSSSRSLVRRTGSSGCVWRFLFDSNFFVFDKLSPRPPAATQVCICSWPRVALRVPPLKLFPLLAIWWMRRPLLLQYLLSLLHQLPSAANEFSRKLSSLSLTSVEVGHPMEAGPAGPRPRPRCRRHPLLWCCWVLQTRRSG